MFNDILGNKREYRWPSDNPKINREIFGFDHMSNNELLDIYFIWRQNYEDPKLDKDWKRSIKDDLDLIIKEIFDR